MIVVNAYVFAFFFMEKMGYANTEQTARGIHTRLFSRAFIVDDGSKRVVFVTADIGMVSQRLRLEVVHTITVIIMGLVFCIQGKCLYIKHLIMKNCIWVNYDQVIFFVLFGSIKGTICNFRH